MYSVLFVCNLNLMENMCFGIANAMDDPSETLKCANLVKILLKKQTVQSGVIGFTQLILISGKNY